MGAGHHHDHGSGPVLRWVLLGNLLFFAFELTAGLWSGSLALVSDAGHALGDSGALLLAVVADALSRAPATDRRSWGLGRARVLGAFVNGLVLAAIGGGVFAEAVRRLLDGPVAPPAGVVVAVGAAGLALNVGSAVLLHRSAATDLNVRGAFLHVVVDAFGSAAAILAGVLLGMGLAWADAAVGIVGSILVLRVAWGLARDAAAVLLEAAPAGVEPEAVRRALMAVPGVLDVHDLHVWSLDGEHALVSVHLRTSAPDALESVHEAAHEALERLHVHHRTLQVELRCRGGCSELSAISGQPSAGSEQSAVGFRHSAGLIADR
jgi:cobalt-zinc-cadmium efflux system protein